MLNQASSLRNVLKVVPKLRDLLRDVRAEYLNDLKQTLEEQVYAELLQNICTVLDDSPMERNTSYNRLFLVRTNINSILDLLRTLYSGVIDEIRQYVAELSLATRMQLKLHHSKPNGFHLLYMLANEEVDNVAEQLSSSFQILSRAGRRYTLSNGRLMAFNEKLNSVAKEIDEISYGIIRGLIESIRDSIDAVYNLVGCLTDLDVVQALAIVSQGKEFCEPTFGEETKIVSGRHPLLESICGERKVVRNNVVRSGQGFRRGHLQLTIISLFKDLHSRVQCVYRHRAQYERQNGVHENDLHLADHGPAWLLYTGIASTGSDRRPTADHLR